MAEAISSTVDSEWPPSHVLHLILEKLTSASDNIRFGTVCKHWRSVALDQKPRPLKSCHKQLPIYVDYHRRPRQPRRHRRN
ncbi:hypothetical protein GBA52_026754 [Prunus armeniaca]|nr:hypothetical protein GBA52_026754 [Prunus armeniaca]